jgi:TolA-binding protein
MTKTILIIFGSIFVNTICFADSYDDFQQRRMYDQQEQMNRNIEEMTGYQRAEWKRQEEQRKLQEQQYQQQHPQMLPSIKNGRLVYTPAQ